MWYDFDRMIDGHTKEGVKNAHSSDYQGHSEKACFSYFLCKFFNRLWWLLQTLRHKEPSHDHLENVQHTHTAETVIKARNCSTCFPSSFFLRLSWVITCFIEKQVLIWFNLKENDVKMCAFMQIYVLFLFSGRRQPGNGDCVQHPREYSSEWGCQVWCHHWPKLNKYPALWILWVMFSFGWRLHH